MKKVLYGLGKGLVILVGVPVLLVACLGYLLFVPFDVIRYRRMPYYKDLGIKYRLFITSKDIVRIYNRIVREQLPIEYYRNDGIEYFISDGQVLLCDRGIGGFEQENGQWFFILDGKSHTKMAMKEVLENEIDLLKPEHRALPAKFLLFYSDITDWDRFEQAKECPYFHCVFSADEDI